jgi:threonine/homoserine/homoserine lactone efflux protein
MDDADRTTPAGAWRLILGIMAALVVWGLFHGVGAWRLNNDVRRLFVVLGCVAAFLGFWGWLLVAKSRALDRARADRSPAAPSRAGVPRIDGRG